MMRLTWHSIEGDRPCHHHRASYRTTLGMLPQFSNGVRSVTRRNRSTSFVAMGRDGAASVLHTISALGALPDATPKVSPSIATGTGRLIAPRRSGAAIAGPSSCWMPFLAIEPGPPGARHGAAPVSRRGSMPADPHAAYRLFSGTPSLIPPRRNGAVGVGRSSRTVTSIEIAGCTMAITLIAGRVASPGSRKLAFARGCPLCSALTGPRNNAVCGAARSNRCTRSRPIATMRAARPPPAWTAVPPGVGLAGGRWTKTGIGPLTGPGRSGAAIVGRCNPWWRFALTGRGPMAVDPGAGLALRSSATPGLMPGVARAAYPLGTAPVLSIAPARNGAAGAMR